MPSLLSFLLLLMFFGSVSPCARIYETCCSSLKTTDIINSRFPDNPAITYTEPDVLIASDCQSAQMDCALPGMETEIFTLVYSDGNGNILKTKTSQTSVFDTSTSDLSCDAGYENRDVFLSCEQGCTLDTCGPVRDCACEPMRWYFNVTGGDQTPYAIVPTAIYGDNCQNISMECINVEESFAPRYIELLVMDTAGFFRSLSAAPVNNRVEINVPGLKCENFNWVIDNGTVLSTLLATCDPWP